MTKYDENWTKEDQKEYMKIYRNKNRKLLNEKRKERLKNNPKYANSVKISRKKWADNNKKYTGIYNKNRMRVDISFKLRMYLRSRINRAIRGMVKAGSAIKELGCSIEEFKLHLENKFKPSMSWENYGKWEIDHIIPLAKFNLQNKIEFEKACHFSNMQPLWKFENRSKRDKHQKETLNA